MHKETLFYREETIVTQPKPQPGKKNDGENKRYVFLFLYSCPLQVFQPPVRVKRV